MSIETVIRQLCLISETIKESMSQEMSEVYLIAVEPKDLEAITTSIFALKGLQILNGVFNEKEAEA